MARTPHILGAEKKKNLMDEIKRNTPFEIHSNRDCQKLAEFIFLVTKDYISVSTLRRLFGFEKSPFHPSQFTIEILEKYIACRQKDASTSNGMSNFLLDMFDPIHFTTISSTDESFQAVYRKAAVLLKNNEALFREVMEPLAKMPHGRVFYYDLFPDYEILPSFQYLGYEFYLQYSQTINDKVFALTILVWSAHRRNDAGDFKKWKEQLNDVKPTFSELHPFVLGRYIACMLQHAESDSAYEQWKNDAVKLASDLRPTTDLSFGQFPGFHYFVADAAHEKKDGALILKLVECAEKNYPKTLEFEWKGYYEQLNLFKAYALYFLGRKSESEVILSSVECSKFYFITKEYFVEKHNTLKKLLTY
jgi:hypothetical protein